MKKNLRLTILIGELLTCSFVFSQTVDEIIARNLESKGGIEKLKAIQSIKITGKVIFQAMEMPMVMWAKRPNMVRIESTFQDKKIVQAFDGEKAWWIMPFLGSEEPQEMTGINADSIKEQADFDGPLMNYKEKGHSIELLGKEDMAGTEVYKLKITFKDGKERFFYLDTESCLELKQLSTIDHQGTPMHVETIFGDYKQVSGIMTSHSIENRINNNPQSQIMIESVEFNIDIEDSFFKMPTK